MYIVAESNVNNNSNNNNNTVVCFFWTPLVLTIKVVKVAGDLRTDGRMNGQGNGWMCQIALDRQTSPLIIPILYRDYSEAAIQTNH